jgi:AraC-like DNA-binding protein
MFEPEIVEAADRMQEYIKDHMNEKITLKQLSEAAGYSPWHSTRIFKELTGRNPFDYIRSLRLSKAALKLRDEEHRIIDVAFDFVFDSHEGFTRAFSREFGLSPKRYSKETPPIQLFLPTSIRSYYQFLNKGEKNMSEKKETKMIFAQVVDRPERKVLLKRGIKATEYFEYCEDVGCDIWALLTSVKEALYEPIGMWLPKHLIKPGTSQYVQGVELPLDYAKEAPAGYEIITLPPCKMMVFQGQPYDDDNFMEEVGEVMDAIDQYDPTLYGFEWAEQEAPRFQLVPMGYRGYIEARPVKPLK